MVFPISIAIAHVIPPSTYMLPFSNQIPSSSLVHHIGYTIITHMSNWTCNLSYSGSFPWKDEHELLQIQFPSQLDTGPYTFTSIFVSNFFLFL